MFIEDEKQFNRDKEETQDKEEKPKVLRSPNGQPRDKGKAERKKKRQDKP